MRLAKCLLTNFVMTVLFLISLAAGHSADAFTVVLNNQGRTSDGWDSNTVTFDIDTSCNSYLTKVHEAIERAKSTWGAVPTSALKVERGSLVTLSSPITTYVGNTASAYAPIGNTIVYCDTNFGTNSNVDANSVPGYATGYNLDGNGKIRGSLLVLNVQSGASANINSLDSTLLGVVLTHEIGHCLGVGHSADTEALMYYQSGAGRQVVLAQDDIDAVTYLYPKQELGKAFPGCGSISTLYPSDTKRLGGGVSGFFKTLGPDIALLMLFLALVHLFKGGRIRLPQAQKI
jgi:hypothetical protein